MSVSFPLRCWIVSSHDLDNVYLQVGDGMKDRITWDGVEWVEHHWEITFKDEAELGKFAMMVVENNGPSFAISQGYDCRDGSLIPVIFISDIYFGFSLDKEKIIDQFWED